MVSKGGDNQGVARSRWYVQQDSSDRLLHPSQKIKQPLIREIQPHKSEARIVQIKDDIDGCRHYKRERE